MTLQILEELQKENTADVQGIYYVRDANSAGVNPEAVAFLLNGGRSVIITSATDWTLKVECGTRRELPKWCYPPDQWEYRPIPEVTPEHALRRSSGFTESRNQVGEIVGVRIAYEDHLFDLQAGEPFAVSRNAL